MITRSNSNVPYRVLVCDGVDNIRREVQKALGANPGFQVVDEAANGHESISKAIQLKPDLVLMDACMPDLDGAEATRQIRVGTPETRVLAYSSDTTWETVDRMFHAGAGGYLVKGTDPDELLCAAGNVVSGGHYLSLALLKPPVSED